MDKLTRAKNLLESANKLFEEENLSGVAGLAYQAVEAAIDFLTLKTNGKNKASHSDKRKRAEELLKLSKNHLKELWHARNIDFYGNERIGTEEKDLDKEEIQKSLEHAKILISKIEKDNT